MESKNTERVIFEMVKKGVPYCVISNKFKISAWKINDACEKTITYDIIMKKLSKICPMEVYPELEGVSAPLFIPYGMALTVGDCV